MSTRKELIEAVGARYRDAGASDKTVILDEFVAITGYHSKHAVRVLGTAAPEQQRRARSRLYDEAVRQALVVLWEAGDRICGKRLRPLIPILIGAMERHGHLELDPVVKAQLLQVSAATIDRSLSEARAHIDGKRRRRTCQKPSLDDRGEQRLRCSDVPQQSHGIKARELRAKVRLDGLVDVGQREQPVARRGSRRTDAASNAGMETSWPARTPSPTNKSSWPAPSSKPKASSLPCAWSCNGSGAAIPPCSNA